MFGDRSGSWSACGQSTLEYALVLTAFLCMVVAFAALWQASRTGVLVDVARESSGHSTEGGVGWDLLRDLVMF